MEYLEFLDPQVYLVFQDWMAAMELMVFLDCPVFKVRQDQEVTLV